MASSSVQAGALLQILKQHAATRKQDRRSDEIPVSTSRSQELESLLIPLSQPVLPANFLAESASRVLDSREKSREESSGSDAQLQEEEDLEWDVTARLLVNTYGRALEDLSKQAREAEDESQWWESIERSRRAAVWYLIQTLPLRLTRVFTAYVDILRANNIEASFNNMLNGQTFRQFMHPTILTTSLFPHLSQSLSRPRLLGIFTSPVTYAQMECRNRRQGLEQLRDQRARQLGQLILQSRSLDKQPHRGEMCRFAVALYSVIIKDETGDSFESTAQPADSEIPTSAVLDPLYDFLSTALPEQNALNKQQFDKSRRPSRLVLLWPRLVIAPPLALISLKFLYNSRITIRTYAKDAVATVRGFWTGWIIEPIKGIINTIRSGGMEGAIISKEGLKSDLDSLERMVLSLCAEKLNFGPDQLEEVAKRIREGDLTEVLKLYEEDMKHPVKSAISGTLVRTVLIQVQKTKVDLDFALTGIDKLIRSQELTFAFVGVAPSLAIVYVFGGWARNAWRGGRGQERLGGRKRRERALHCMRRVERLLNSPDIAPEALNNISDLTTGLLFLSLSSLREYATTYMAPGTRLRDGFIEDISDLENPHLGRMAKIRVVERIWRCWGGALGWTKTAPVS